MQAKVLAPDVLGQGARAVEEGVQLAAEVATQCETERAPEFETEEQAASYDRWTRALELYIIYIMRILCVRAR